MSTANPFMKFYPQDWRADEKLRLCSLSARGLWIEMLALMHRSDRYGTLLINGNIPTMDQLAVQVGASVDEVSEMVGQLESAGVFSRTGTGAIYSRRMKRDEKKAKIARENGKSGGNPKLKGKGSKQRENPASDKGGDKPVDKGGLKPQIPEARDQIPDKEEGNSHNQSPENTAVDAADAADGRFAFAGEIIRLNDMDLAKWRRTYHAIPDLDAELAAIDAWLQDQPATTSKGWFHSVPRMLNRKHQEIVAERTEVERMKYARPIA